MQFRSIACYCWPSGEARNNRQTSCIGTLCSPRRSPDRVEVAVANPVRDLDALPSPLESRRQYTTLPIRVWPDCWSRQRESGERTRRRFTDQSDAHAVIAVSICSLTRCQYAQTPRIPQHGSQSRHGSQRSCQMNGKEAICGGAGAGDTPTELDTTTRERFKILSVRPLGLITGEGHRLARVQRSSHQ